MAKQRTKEETLAWLRTIKGELSTATLKRLDSLPWYVEMPPGRRSAVGLVAQAGITSFITWYDNPRSTPWVAADVFGNAPRELLRSISLQQTLQLIRVAVEVVEQRVESADDPSLRHAVLEYSREIAFASADVYARAAEARGLWDARLEALVVDSILTGEYDDELPSRIAALGWMGLGEVAVLIGSTPRQLDVDNLRRTARHAGADVLIGVQGKRLVVVIGRAAATVQPTRSGEVSSDEPAPSAAQSAGASLVQSLDDAVVEASSPAAEHDLSFFELATKLIDSFGPDQLVLGPVVPSIVEASHSARAALAGYSVAPAWRGATRPIEADDLLPERALAGDPLARSTLVNRVYKPLQRHQTDLTTTLRCYLDNGRSLEATARELFVHPNTVRYRLKRVSDVIGWDATGAREAFILQCALVLGAVSESHHERRARTERTPGAKRAS